MDHSSYPKQRKEKYNKTYLNDSSLHNVSACTNMRYFELDRLLLILMILRMRELLSARLLSLNGKKKWWSVIWSELAWECKNETETAAENANMFNNRVRLSYIQCNLRPGCESSSSTPYSMLFILYSWIL